MKLSISQHFHNKRNNAPMKTAKDGTESNRYAMAAFTTVDWTPDQIADHLAAGKAICVAALDGNWRGQAQFISSQLMGVDFDHGPDVETLVTDPFIKAYAFYVYPTPSHTPDKPRSRALFALDTPVTDYDHYRVLMARLLEKLGVFEADPSCKDPVRIFYGSDVEGRRGRSAGKVLPLAVLEALPKTADETLREQRAKEPPPPFQPADSREGKRAQAYSEAARNRIISDALANNSEGYRHNAFIGAVWQLAALEKGGWPGINADADARYLGGAMDRDADEVEKALTGARRKVDPSWFELPPIHEPRVSDYVSPEPGKPETKPEPVVKWKSSDETMLAVDAMMTTPPKGYLPLLFPFKSIHKLGGMAHIIPPGKLLGVVGASGGMKTSFLETITDEWRRGQGVDVLFWGTEWTPDEMANRATQRYGGASLTDVMLHQLWLAEEDAIMNGREVRNRRGKRLSDDVIVKTNHISYTIRNKWPGKAHYIADAVSDVDVVLRMMNDKTDELRTAGRNVQVAVFDYLQLIDLYAARSESDRITSILGKVKLFCQEKRLIGVVASQVTKSAGSDMRDGALLQAESGQFVRSDKFNLVVTLNPIYDGQYITPRGVINVVKNSLGKTESVEVGIDPSRFIWIDDTLFQPKPADKARANGVQPHYTDREPEAIEDVPF